MSDAIAARKGFVWSLLVAIVLTIGATVSIVLMVTDPPRQFVTWIALTVLCTSELLAGLLAVRSAAGGRESGATRAILGGIVVLYSLASIIAVAVYGQLTYPSGGHELVLGAVLIGIATIAVVAGIAICGQDLWFQAEEAPRITQRGRDADQAFGINETAHQLANVVLNEPAARRRLQSIVKSLEGLATALAHTSGQHKIAEEIGPSVRLLAGLASELQGEDLTDVDGVLRRLEETTSSVRRDLAQRRML